jgi:hypothetical protein
MLMHTLAGALRAWTWVWTVTATAAMTALHTAVVSVFILNFFLCP